MCSFDLKRLKLDSADGAVQLTTQMSWPASSWEVTSPVQVAPGKVGKWRTAVAASPLGAAAVLGASQATRSGAMRMRTEIVTRSQIAFLQAQCFVGHDGCQCAWLALAAPMCDARHGNRTCCRLSCGVIPPVA